MEAFDQPLDWEKPLRGQTEPQHKKFSVEVRLGPLGIENIQSCNSKKIQDKLSKRIIQCRLPTIQPNEYEILLLQTLITSRTGLEYK